MIKGRITDGKLEYEVEKNYYEDDEVFIAIDGKENAKDIKELYEKYGEEFVKEIDGFFSTYLYDKKNNTLILVKDKMGLKPIYYYLNNGNIYFGRNIMDIVKGYNINEEINVDALSMYFRLHYINPPETIFKNIYKLQHGHYLVYKDNKLKDVIYWDVIDVYNKNSKMLINNYDEAKKELNNKLSNFIKQIVNSNEKVGVYLSSGIDSSLTAALCSKYSEKQIDTYTVGFFEKDIDEASSSKKVAEFLKTNHHEIYVGEKEMLNNIKKIPEYYQEPFADPSELPTIILNEYAKENDIKIAATGDSGDQLFCGLRLYDTFWKIAQAKRIFNFLNININSEFIKKHRKLSYVYANGDPRYKVQCDIAYLERNLKGLFKDSGNKRFEEESRIETKNIQEKRMILDLDKFIPNRICIKQGTATNKNGIEIRSPYLNTEVIELSFKIPHKFKYHKRNKKYILKQILYDYVPKEYFSNKKRGFVMPTKKWLKTALNDDLKRVSTYEYVSKQNIFNYDALQKILDRIDDDEITMIIWDYYVFQLWYEKYMM